MSALRILAETAAVAVLALLTLGPVLYHHASHTLTRHLERADRYDDVDQREQRVLAAWRRVGMGGRR